MEPNSGQTVTGALNGAIGNDGLQGRPKPNGNVWPVDVDASTTPWPVPVPNPFGVAIIDGWVSPATWTSLQNDNPIFNLEYYRFNNEFVRSNAGTSNSLVKIRNTAFGQIRVYPVGTTAPTPQTGIEYFPQCSSDLPHVFPLRMAVADTSHWQQNLTNQQTYLSGNRSKAALGDAVPNPASVSCFIPIFIPEGSTKEYSILVFGFNGKTELISLPVYSKGKQTIEVNTASLPPGVYGYSLLEGNQRVGTRKLVIIR